MEVDDDFEGQMEDIPDDDVQDEDHPNDGNDDGEEPSEVSYISLRYVLV